MADPLSDGVAYLSNHRASCIACAKPMLPGQGYFPDESGGAVHAACLGPERECYTLDGEPLGPDDPIPTPYIWED